MLRLLPRPLRMLVAAETPQSGCGSLSPAGLRGPPPRPEHHLCGAAGGAGGPGTGSPWAPLLGEGELGVNACQLREMIGHPLVSPGGSQCCGPLFIT